MNGTTAERLSNIPKLNQVLELSRVEGMRIPQLAITAKSGRRTSETRIMGLHGDAFTTNCQTLGAEIPMYELTGLPTTEKALELYSMLESIDPNPTNNGAQGDLYTTLRLQSMLSDEQTATISCSIFLLLSSLLSSQELKPVAIYTDGQVQQIPWRVLALDDSRLVFTGKPNDEFASLWEITPELHLAKLIRQSILFIVQNGIRN